MAKETVPGRICKCAAALVDARTLHVMRAAGLVERGMIAMTDMDAWYLEAVEFALADRMRAIEQKQQAMQQVAK